MTATPQSLFDTASTWQQTPLEAASAWLMDPTFVLTRQGVQQPLRPGSVRVYRAMAHKFIREVIVPEEGVRPGKPWPTVELVDVQGFLEKHQLNKGIRNRYIRLLERLFDHLISLSICSSNPVRALAIRAPSKSGENNDRSYWLTPQQQNALVDALPDDEGWKARRNRALISTIIGGGLRPSEVIGLRLDAIGQAQADGSLYIQIPAVGAGRAHRTKVPQSFAGMLREWLVERDEFCLPGDLVFPASLIGGVLHPSTVYRWIAAALKEAGIRHDLVKRRGARTLRNTFALRELAGGQALESVGEYLGHRSDRATSEYKVLLKRLKDDRSPT